tara:strand:- start:21235 stop:22752 length:1518 start_codon:yes stop_codon:yes gene_type:complete
MSFSLDRKYQNFLWCVLVLALASRILTMAFIPLTDTTESRYGEIARKMVETNDWVTLQHDYGIPFWAKPPLSTWLAAGSMKLFGISEFAVRLPSLLLAVSILLMTWYIGKLRHNKEYGLLSAAILCSFPLFYIASGTVMTDMALAFSTCISFITFWLAISTHEKYEAQLYGWLFFVGLGLGLLAKGPICGVMTIFPILLWMLRKKLDWLELWHKLPWIKGSLIMLLIAAPWYSLAENSTPGFLQYFLVGEHIKRFLVSGWEGDLYGYAHQQPTGTIWVFWILAALPWSLLAIPWILAKGKGTPSLFKDQDGWAWYLFCWAIWPMLFFTLAKNIIWPYVITSLPASALLTTELWHRHNTVQEKAPLFVYRHWLWIPFMMSTFLVAGMLPFVYAPIMEKFTQKFFIQEYLQRRTSQNSQLYYLFQRYSSAEFYSHGTAKHTDNQAIFKALLNDNIIDFIILKDKDLMKIDPKIISLFMKIKNAYGTSLYVEKNTPITREKLVKTGRI